MFFWRISYLEKWEYIYSFSFILKCSHESLLIKYIKSICSHACYERTCSINESYHPRYNDLIENLYFIKQFSQLMNFRGSKTGISQFPMRIRKIFPTAKTAVVMSCILTSLFLPVPDSPPFSPPPISSRRLYLVSSHYLTATFSLRRYMPYVTMQVSFIGWQSRGYGPSPIRVKRRGARRNLRNEPFDGHKSWPISRG